ncbi:Abi family protein, partial [Thalassolituus sp. UBA2590]|uniref:Abi family protein n=1 Tax=Thalassolituus sp. UBA2590 TaxID=1947663 RepID=UPI0026474B0F
MTYTRPWLSFKDQLEHLKSRGLVVTDDSAALKALEQFGYYRLSAYWYPFRQKSFDTKGRVSGVTDDYIPNTELKDSVQLY